MLCKFCWELVTLRTNWRPTWDFLASLKCYVLTCNIIWGSICALSRSHFLHFETPVVLGGQLLELLLMQSRRNF